MTPISYYGPQPIYTRPRPVGLIIWGIVFLILGAIISLMAMLGVLGTVMISAGVSARPNQPHASLGQTVMGVFILMVFAALMITVGIGCIRARRWVRPITVTASAMAFLGGLQATLSMAFGWRSMLATMQATQQQQGGTPIPVGFILAITIVFSALFYVLLPGAIWLYFVKRSVGDALRELDPHIGWTDRVPLPLFAWAAASALLGVCSLATLVNGRVACFQYVLTGPACAVVTLAFCVSMVAGALLVYRRSMAGWWLTIVLVGLFTISTLVHLLLGDVSADIEAMAHASGLQHPVVDATYFRALGIGSAMQFVIAISYAIWARQFVNKPTDELTSASQPAV